MTSLLKIKGPQSRPRTSQLVILMYYIFMSMGTALVESNAIVSLYLKHYSNPKHRDIHGDTCDLSYVGFIRTCDNEITLCIDDIGSATGNCQYFDRVIYERDDDNFNFPSVLRYSSPNPIPISFPAYKGGFRLVMTIYDEDDGNDDDLVDRYNEDIYITPSRSAETARTHSYTLTGPGYSQTTIEVKAYCDNNFYGTNCLVHCVPFDNDEEGHYSCDSSTGDKVCLPGYTGTLCNNKIDGCESSPCQNGGSCRNHFNYYRCECANGTLGERCETNVDECASEPCQHRSTCIDQINGYQCQCEDGYTGLTCSVDVDECANAPCKHNATCVDHLNGYTCKCHPGYRGSQCEGPVWFTTSLSINLVGITIFVIVIYIGWICFKMIRREHEGNSNLANQNLSLRFITAGSVQKCKKPANSHFHTTKC